MKKVFIIAFTVLLSACTSNYDRIYIATTGGEGASCRVKNQAGSWQVSAPGSLTVKKSADDLRISCANKQSNLTGAKRVKADEDGRYPDEVIVRLAKKQKGDKDDEDDSDLTPLHKLPEGSPDQEETNEKQS